MRADINFEILEAQSAEKKTIENLLSLYLHDMSQFAPFLKIGSDGRFRYQNIDLYWENHGLTPFLIKAENRLAGLILFNSSPYVPDEIDYGIHEFFILARLRRRGLGKAVLKRLFGMFPGKYYVAQLTSNQPAIEFWHRVYDSLGIRYDEAEETEAGVRILTQRFTV